MGKLAILEKEVWVSVSNNVTYYEKLGYKIPRKKNKYGKVTIPRGTKILVNVDDLPIGSGVNLTKICDDCGTMVFNQKYYEILTQRKEGDGKDRCFKCGNRRRGKNKSDHMKQEIIGQVNKNKYGSIMKVEKYKNSQNVWIRFELGNYLTKTTLADFKKGKVMNVYDRSNFGVGYLGEGIYKPSIEGKRNPIYATWNGMLKRCYQEKYKEKFTTYKEAKVCEEWLNFQNFAAWYDENYYEVDGERMELDKDILVKGNKTYSPEYCIFVPERINYLFIKCDARRGNLPIGVYQHTQTKKYVANCNNGNKKTINLGSYNTPEEAFLAYKPYKEKLIKRIAEEYKNKIPYKLYEAMKRYNVEIDD